MGPKADVILHKVSIRILPWTANDQGPEKHTNIKEYLPEAGLDVLPAGSGRRASPHDWLAMGVGRFLKDSVSEENSFIWHSFMCLLGA